MKRNDEIVTLYVTPKWNEENQKYMIGVHSNIFYCISLATKDTWQNIIGVYTALAGMISILYGISTYATPSTTVIFFMLLAILSSNLGIFNLLPIPGFDGSHIVTALLEKIVGNTIGAKATRVIHVLAASAVCFLDLCGYFKDLYAIIYINLFNNKEIKIH